MVVLGYSMVTILVLEILPSFALLPLLQTLFLKQKHALVCILQSFGLTNFALIDVFLHFLLNVFLSLLLDHDPILQVRDLLML